MTKRRRLLGAAAALVAGAAAIAGSLRWDIPAEAVRGRLEQALARDTGYKVVSIGSAAFTALPWPVLQVGPLELAKGGNSAEKASIPLVKARINVFSWLTGDPRITAISLFEPHISLASAETMEETEAVATVITNYLRQDRRSSLTSLRIQSGEVRLDGANLLSGLALSVSNVAGNDLRLFATGAYRGQPLDLSAVVSSVPGAGERPLAWDLTVGDLKAGFRGSLVAPPALDADGQFSIVLGAGALRSRPFSFSRDLAMLLDDFSISGTGRVALPQLQLRDAVIQQGGQSVRGAIDFTASPTQPRLLATLHAETLDLSAPVGRVLGALSQELRPDVALRAAWLGAGFADIRFSARRLEIGQLRLEGAALSLKLGGGRSELSVSEARLAGGLVKGRASLAMSGGQFELRTSGQVDQVDIGEILKGRGAAPALTGLLSSQWSLDGAGRTLGEIAAGAAGKGHAAIRNGEFAGLDAERFLRRPEAASGPPPDGRSRFQQADAAWRVDAGVATLTESRLRAPLWEARLEGHVSLATRRLDLLARLMLQGPEAQRTERPLRILGTIDTPDVTALPAQIFRRS